jgi:hypothetical protein
MWKGVVINLVINCIVILIRHWLLILSVVLWYIFVIARILLKSSCIRRGCSPLMKLLQGFANFDKTLRPWRLDRVNDRPTHSRANNRLKILTFTTCAITNILSIQLSSWLLLFQLILACNMIITIYNAIDGRSCAWLHILLGLSLVDISSYYWRNWQAIVSISLHAQWFFDVIG